MMCHLKYYNLKIIQGEYNASKRRVQRQKMSLILRKMY